MRRTCFGPRHGLFWGGLTAFLLTGCGATPSSLPPQKSVAAPVILDTKARRAAVGEVVASLDEMLEALRVETGAPGLSAAVLLDGEVIWQGAAGMADAEAKAPMATATVGRAASVTKLFTGAAILMLRDAGLLSLDAPVATYLPEVAEVLYPSADSPRMTVRHLVTHTSGLPRLGQLDYVTRPAQGPTADEVLAGLKGLALESVPGQRVTYSNLGAALAGILVSRVAQMPYETFVTERILKPLGMAASKWSRDGYAPSQVATGSPKADVGLFAPHHWVFGAANAAGGLYLNADDLAKFGAFQLAAWPPRDAEDTAPLRRASIRESHLLAGGGAGKGGHGIFWVVSSSGPLGHVVGHTGATDKFSSSIILAPQKGVGAVALANLGMGVTDPVVGKLTMALVSALESVAIQVPPALAKGVERVSAMMTSPTLEVTSVQFTADYRKIVPDAAVVGLFERLGQVPGPCKIGAAIEVVNPAAGSFRIGCKGRSFRLDLSVEDAAPHLITALRIKPE